MLLLTLLLCSILNGIFCDPYECFIEEREKCDKSMVRRDYPETIEELRIICNDFNSYGRCNINAHESCEYNADEESLKEMRKSFDFLNSVCQEDNPIYQVISSNLECIAPAARKLHEDCDQFKFSEKNFQIAARHEKEISDNYEREDMLECLSPFWDVSCQSIMMGLYCGSEVKNAINTVMVNVNDRYQKCTTEILEELQPLYETYKSVIEAEQQFRNSSKDEDNKS